MAQSRFGRQEGRKGSFAAHFPRLPAFQRVCSSQRVRQPDKHEILIVSTPPSPPRASRPFSRRRECSADPARHGHRLHDRRQVRRIRGAALQAGSLPPARRKKSRHACVVPRRRAEGRREGWRRDSEDRARSRRRRNRSGVGELPTQPEGDLSCCREGEALSSQFSDSVCVAAVH